METAPARISMSQVFASKGDGLEESFLYTPSNGKISYFVGRNGSGKSKTARVIASELNGRYLSTDRLMGIMSFTKYSWGTVPSDYEGPPVKQSRSMIDRESKNNGTATDILLTLRDDPVVALKVAAFIRRTLGRTIEFRENAGFFDPYLQLDGVEYSLLRDEGHGLRELTILLAAAYSTDWSTLVVDEPELHLHPALAQLWVSELSRECAERGVHAIIVTHEPTMVRPSRAEELSHIWLFRPGALPQQFSAAIHPGTESRLTASLRKHPQLLSQLAFAPRAVLVEGPHDVAALTAALARTQTPAVIAQTDLAPCGSSGEVVLWYELARRLNIDVRAIADLDALFSSDVHRTINRDAAIQERLRSDMLVEPPRAHLAIDPLVKAANAADVAPNEKARARWLADSVAAGSGDEHRRDRLLAILRQEGLWLHPEGTIEDVLGIVKGKADPASAANSSGRIDSVTAWCAYDLDPLGDLEFLLRAAVERIANNVTQALGSNPDVVLTGPVGSMAESDAKLVDIVHIADQRYRIIVKSPASFAGYFAEVDRDTPPSLITLQQPEKAG